MINLRVIVCYGDGKWVQAGTFNVSPQGGEILLTEAEAKNLKLGLEISLDGIALSRMHWISNRKRKFAE